VRSFGFPTASQTIIHLVAHAKAGRILASHNRSSGERQPRSGVLRTPRHSYVREVSALLYPEILIPTSPRYEGKNGTPFDAAARTSSIERNAT
jgi:hypothetical protein